MPIDDLKRVADDLSAVRQAMRLDQPYAPDDVGVLLLVAAAGPVALALLYFTPLQPPLCFLLGLLPLLAVFGRKTLQHRRDQATRPNLWRETKLSLIAAAVAGFAALGWLLLTRVVDVPHRHAGSTIACCIGIGLAMIGAVDSTRRAYLMSGVTMTAWAATLLLVPTISIPVCTAAFLTVAGLAGAAAIWWQVRHDQGRQVEGNPVR